MCNISYYIINSDYHDARINNSHGSDSNNGSDYIAIFISLISGLYGQNMKSSIDGELIF